jgi:hypothetical protein
MGAHIAQGGAAGAHLAARADAEQLGPAVAAAAARLAALLVQPAAAHAPQRLRLRLRARREQPALRSGFAATAPEHAAARKRAAAQPDAMRRAPLNGNFASARAAHAAVARTC